jgi:hypothetical protein
MNKADYAARIPPCCFYRTLEDHINGLGLCWSLVTATEQKAPMDCSGCDLAMPGVKTLNWLPHTAPETGEKDA